MQHHNERARPRDPINAYVGTRIRLRRKMLGMSQEKLASAIGVTFQQVQKYEKGMSGIGASQLHRIAGAMQVPPSYFFPASGDVAADEEAAGFAVDALSNSESVQLNLAVAQIRDPAVRRRVIDLVHSIAATAD